MVCVHGWAGYERTFDTILPYFNPHFTVYQLAWPGYSAVPLRGRDYTLDDMVRWIDTFTDKMGLGKITLMGNCIGANVALEYAYQHPERLTHLIVNEPHGFMPVYCYLLIYPVIGDLFLRLLFKTQLGITLIMKMFPLEEGGNKGSGYTKRRLLQVPTHVMGAFLRAMYRYARETNLYARPKVKVPTVFPLPTATFGQVAAFERCYGPCFETLTICKISQPVHNPARETPQAFAKAVLPQLGIRG